VGHVAIRIDRLAKRYPIGQPERYRTLRDTLARAAWGAFRGGWRGTAGRPGPEPVWALRDVSFEVGEGEIIGIVGRNGAGKTTLLRILSRVTRPSSGYAETRGRVGSLLDVGAGSNRADCRENVLNGAILHEEIEIAELTPSWHLPSWKPVDTGQVLFERQYMRLAFAGRAFRAGHLPGGRGPRGRDLAFQRKMPRKVSEVGRNGRTVCWSVTR
jgi:lipopolysaccharide transport system ATP-binding protein